MSKKYIGVLAIVLSLVITLTTKTNYHKKATGATGCA